MNEHTSNGAQEDAGDRLARHVATGIASLIGIAIVASGAVIVDNRISVTELQQKCAGTRDDVFELHSTLSAYPSAADLIGCRQRLEKLEQYLAVDQHRMDKLEKVVEDLARKPDARPDPFTGTQGRELLNRIEALESNRKHP